MVVPKHRKERIAIDLLDNMKVSSIPILRPHLTITFQGQNYVYACFLYMTQFVLIVHSYPSFTMFW